MRGFPAAVAAILAGCAACAAAVPEATLERGGVTFDFKRIGDERLSSGTVGENLVTADTSVPIVVTEEGWQHAGHVKVALPEDVSGKFRVTFRYRMKHRKMAIGGSGGICLGYRQGADGRTSGQLIYIPMVNSAADWNLASSDFTFDPGHRSVDFTFRLSGEGEIRVKDVTLHRLEPPKEEVRITAEPCASLDDAFAVSEGQCGVITYVWETRELEKRYHAGKIEVRLAVTGDFAATNRIVHVGTPWPRVNFWNTLGVLVRSTGRTGAEGEIAAEVWYEGRRISNVSRVRLVTVPRIAAEIPERYTTGFTVGGSYLDTLKDEASKRAFTRACAEYGVRWAVSNRAYLPFWREAGMKYVTTETDVANGYEVGIYMKEKRPADERFVPLGAFDVPGVPRSAGQARQFSVSACPVSVYGEMPFFKGTFLPRLKEKLAGFDGMWANWEPYGFDGKGCFCDRCLGKFAAYVGEPAESLRKDWPRCAIEVKGEKGRHWAAYRRFRSLEHAKLVKTIDRYVREYTGGERSVGFMPGVGFDQVTSIWKEWELAACYQPHDYLGELRWLEPWGPYPNWNSREPYVYLKCDQLRYWCAAKDIRETLDREFGAKAPKIQAYPQGAQADGWIVQPEWLEMAMDSFFFNGWESTVVYYFPKGYDARWWRAFANATTRAARFERFVRDGRRCDARVALKPVREYAQPSPRVGGRFPQFVDVPSLQHAAYELDGSVAVAAFNFWEKGEAFFRLQAKDLPPGDYTVTDDAGVLWTPDGGRSAWTAAELAHGIVAAVPACRTRVFAIRPGGSAPAGLSVMTAGRIREVFGSRVAALKEAAEADAAYERENRCEQTAGKMEVYR